MTNRRPVCSRCGSVCADEPLTLMVTSRDIPRGLPDPLRLCVGCADALRDFVKGDPPRFALSPDR
jgi:hypothetical protein